MEKTLEKPVKILIDYNEAGHKSVFNSIVRFSSDVKGFKRAFNAYANEIGLNESFTLELLQDVLNFGRKAIENKIEALAATKEKPLRTYYLESWYKDLKELDTNINAVHSWRKTQSAINEIPIEFAQVENFQWNDDNDIVIDETFQNAIKSHFEVYLTSDLEKQVWDRYKAIETAYNSFFELAKENNLYVPENFEGLFGQSFEISRTVIKAHPRYFFPIRTKREY